MQAKIKVQHYRIQEKMPINIVTYGICREIHQNGLQSTLRTLTVPASTLVFVVEGITARMMAELFFTRLAASVTLRLTAVALLACVPYFM